MILRARLTCYALLVALCVLLSAGTANAQQSFAAQFANSPNDVIETQVVDQHQFFGLAGYYNTARYAVVDQGRMTDIDGGEDITLGPDEWLAVIGRFNVLAIQAEGLSFTVDDKKLTLGNSNLLMAGTLAPENIRIDLVQKPDLKAHAPELDKVRYSHLFILMNLLSRVLEAVLIFLHSVIGNWGLAIVAISFFLKIALLPLSRIVSKLQDEVSKTQSALAPKLAHIKANYKGEDAHKRFMAAHKEQGVTTFYALKPMIGLLVQIPIWIAIFNVLAEMPQLKGHGFLWIKDLAYPDAVAAWGTPIPLLGNTLNILPIIMTVVTIASTLSFQDKFAPPEALKKQKRNLYLMAAGFLILFYPFPSGMVLYWTLANILNAIQQKITQ